MTNQRYNQLMAQDSTELTPAEIAEGWHFCCEFDGLLVGPEMLAEMSICQCPGFEKFKPVSPEPIEGPAEEIGTGLFRLADGEIVGNEPDH